ncbi:hypothetical protein [Brevundimonas lutea]|uniref:hypothetical protein n=1 Tax=Brevundimonas lutea TaxID=2293980 RepID=UPI000F030BB0|nr:hypothetical protein [Brevundimonas lutea]
MSEHDIRIEAGDACAARPGLRWATVTVQAADGSEVACRVPVPADAEGEALRRAAIGHAWVVAGDAADRLEALEAPTPDDLEIA